MVWKTAPRLRDPKPIVFNSHWKGIVRICRRRDGWEEGERCRFGLTVLNQWFIIDSFAFLWGSGIRKGRGMTRVHVRGVHASDWTIIRSDGNWRRTLSQVVFFCFWKIGIALIKKGLNNYERLSSYVLSASRHTTSMLPALTSSLY